jgi:integrase
LVANLPPVWHDGRRQYPKARKIVEATGLRRAERALAAWLEELERASSIDAARLTVKDLSDRYLEHTGAIVRPATQAFYRQILEAYVLPRVGETALLEAKPSTFTRLYAQLAQSGLSERTVHHVDSVLHGMYAWAVEDELLEANPIKRIKRRRRPRVSANERKVWSDDQIARAVAASQGLLVRVPLILAAWAGLRRGEVCALRWENVNLDEGWLLVRETLEQTGNEDLHRLPPKSNTGMDWPVPLPSQAVEILRAHRAAQDEMRLASGRRWNREGYVCCRSSGEPLKPDNLSSAWHRFCLTRKFDPISFHDLRHSYASNLFEQGGDDKARMLKIVQRRVRHSDPATTARIYLHVSDEANDAATATQEARIGAAMAKVAEDSPSIRPDPVSLVTRRERNTSK